MKKLLSVLTLFMFISLTQAQIPGFQGKRCIISAQLGVGHGGIVGRPGKMPSLIPTLNVEYVIKRNISINPYYSFMYYSYKNPNLLPNISSSEVNELRNMMLMHQIGVNFKFYRKNLGYLAPVGRYYTLGVFYNYTNQKIYSTYGLSTWDSPSGNDIMAYKAITHNAGITVGMGRSFVIARRMTLDFGGNIHVMPYFKLNGKDYIESEARKNMLLRNIWQIYLSIGFLAF